MDNHLTFSGGGGTLITSNKRGDFMSKKVVSIVSLIIVVVVLATCLVACNADSYVKKLEKMGYEIEVFENLDDELMRFLAGIVAANEWYNEIEWVIDARRAFEYSCKLMISGEEQTITSPASVETRILKFTTEDAAKGYEQKNKEYLMADDTTKRIGKIVVVVVAPYTADGGEIGKAEAEKDFKKLT